ncbi:MAG: tetratricopeptide repeat protein [Alphaproteobacteria bacterium]|nr:tetratricopeptide repeat protein [Alphaproteobacteria bacterium]
MHIEQLRDSVAPDRRTANGSGILIRVLIYLALLAAIAFGLSWLADHPGQITIAWPWLGREIRISLLAGLAGLLALFVALMICWRLLRFIFHVPAAMSMMARARRARKGIEAVTRGMIAAGSGDARESVRASKEASRLMGNDPLALLLRAQSAQAAGDRAQAEDTFKRMLENPRTRLIGLRGLYLEARKRGDDIAATALAQEAHDAAPLPWAGQALLEQRAMSDDWRGALSVVEANLARKTIDKSVGNRQRGVLKTAIGLDLSGRDPDEALRLAREAIKLAPDLIPAYVLAGRMLSRKNDLRRAARILEDGWRVSPHPDLAMAYVDLRPGDSAAERLARARTLAKVSPHHGESRLMLARAALDARDFDLARATIAPLIDTAGKRPTVRTCLLMADLEEAQQGAEGPTREWLARAARAPRDPLWIADGFASDEWAPASPVTGRIDAFVWDTPAERLAAPQDIALPKGTVPKEIAPEAAVAIEPPAPAAFHAEGVDAKPDPAHQEAAGKEASGKEIVIGAQPISPAAEAEPDGKPAPASAASAPKPASVLTGQPDDPGPR